MMIREFPLPERAQHPDWRSYQGLMSHSHREVFGEDAGEADPVAELASVKADTTWRARFWLAERDGELIGLGSLQVNTRDEPDTALLFTYVASRYRGHGAGRKIADTLIDAARDMGARRIRVYAWLPLPGSDARTLASPVPGGGVVPADDPATRLCVALGMRLAQVARVSRCEFAGAAEGWAAHLEEARAAAGPEYRLVTFTDEIPQDMLDDYADMKTNMGVDIPLGESTVASGRWDADRLRDFHAERMIRFRPFIAVAEHVPSGKLVAMSELMLPRHAAGELMAEQWGTFVLAEHRGHRLGMLVKAANLLALTAASPRTRSVLTGNAEENGPMLDINDALGFRPALAEACFEAQIA